MMCETFEDRVTEISSQKGRLRIAYGPEGCSWCELLANATTLRLDLGPYVCPVIRGILQVRIEARSSSLHDALCHDPMFVKVPFDFLILFFFGVGLDDHDEIRFQVLLREQTSHLAEAGGIVSVERLSAQDLPRRRAVDIQVLPPKCAEF